MSDHRCTYSNDCQFAPLGAPLIEYGGRLYCPLHLPNDSEAKIRSNWAPLLKSFLENLGSNLDGVVFHSGRCELASNHGRTTLHHCTFGQACLIAVGDRGAVMTDCAFSGALVIQPGPGPFKVEAKFLDQVTLQVGGYSTCNVDMSGCDFAGGLVVVGSPGKELSGRLNFRGAYFRRPLTVSHFESKFSQDITFARAHFLGDSCAPEHEGHYRAIRKEFEENSDRESEGQFYALEKRCHRASLPFLSLSRFVSATYGGVSEYGQSYERALIVFLVIQLVALVGYGLASGYICLGGSFSADRLLQLVAFTLAQVAKPFDLLVGRGLDGTASAIVSGGSSARWGLAAAAHSVLSLVALALTVLAIRWRFRRA